MKLKTMFLLIFCIVLVVPVFAYIDPNTGSYLVQFAIAGFLAVSFIIKAQWQRIVAIFKKRTESAKQKSNESKN